MNTDKFNDLVVIPASEDGGPAGWTSFLPGTFQLSLSGPGKMSVRPYTLMAALIVNELIEEGEAGLYKLEEPRITTCSPSKEVNCPV